MASSNECSKMYMRWIGLGALFVCCVALAFLGLNIFLCAALSSIIFGTSIWASICQTKPSSSKIVKDTDSLSRVPLTAADHLENGATAAGSAGKEKPRMYFLDNIKIFLTFIVVCHHTTGAFAGESGGWLYNIGTNKSECSWFLYAILSLNQSYFMCMFFFISGYFIPASFARKGYNEFMRDKNVRLGVRAIYSIGWDVRTNLIRVRMYVT